MNSSGSSDLSGVLLFGMTALDFMGMEERCESQMTSGRLATTMSFSRDVLKARLTQLAGCGIYIGTSSWKYPGWCGLVYDEQRYLTLGKFSDAKFNRLCL